MSAVSGESDGQDFDLNIAPIIDCFTVLIAYLLISASFISIGVFDVGVASPSAEASTTPPPPDPGESLSVRVGAANALEVQLRGRESATMPIGPRPNGQPDLARLRDSITRIKARWPALAEASVSAEPRTNYENVVGTVESLKGTQLKVYLSD